MTGLVQCSTLDLLSPFTALWVLLEVHCSTHDDNEDADEDETGNGYQNNDSIVTTEFLTIVAFSTSNVVQCLAVNRWMAGG